MKQFQYEVTDPERLAADLADLKDTLGDVDEKRVLFHIFTEKLDEQNISSVIRAIRGKYPEASVIGVSTNGSIKDGVLTSAQTVVTCTYFEDPETHFEVMAFPLTSATEERVTSAVKKAVSDRPWVSAVEMLVTMRQLSMTKFCDDLADLRPEVQVFGGGAFSENINIFDAFVISGETISPIGVVFVLYGGPNLHVRTTYVTGWKPLSRPLKVTKADGVNLIELDGQPAYDTYFRYLQIRNDRDFFKNTLEFPFVYTRNGATVLRAPILAKPDGTLVMTADVDEGAYVRIAYGDPFAVLQDVAVTGKDLEQFQPEAVMLFSCAARKFYWLAAAEGMQNVEDRASQETRPFESLAPTSGFYTSGEFIRTNGVVSQHNVTLVIAGFREGDVSFESRNFSMNIEFSERLSMVQRLATFIRASNEELEQAYHKLEIQAITDGLTGVLNRRRIQELITDAVSSAGEEGKLSLIMLDIDDFKHINDTWGHAEGDRILIALGNLLNHEPKRLFPASSVGRWGGEEFMILLPDRTKEEAGRLAEFLRTAFAAEDFGNTGQVTVSIGYTSYRDHESADSFAKRADEALYEAKARGKNCSVGK